MFSKNKKEFPFTFPSFGPRSFSAHRLRVWFCTPDSSSPPPLRLSRSLAAAQLGPSPSPLYLLAWPRARWSPSGPGHAGVHGGHGRRPSPSPRRARPGHLWSRPLKPACASVPPHPSRRLTPCITSPLPWSAAPLPVAAPLCRLRCTPGEADIAGSFGEPSRTSSASSRGRGSIGAPPSMANPSWSRCPPPTVEIQLSLLVNVVGELSPDVP
jgi:hypothetical protein